MNLIAGKNNTGKTALLEALFLFSGPNNPSLPTLVNIVPQACRKRIKMQPIFGVGYSRASRSTTPSN